MSQYRDALPQLGKKLFLMDGGLETTLVFLDNWELPHFAAFDLLSQSKGRQRLVTYFSHYIELALARRSGLILEAPTWRAQKDWGAKLGYSPADLNACNQDAVQMLADLRDQHQTDDSPMVISGCIGPRGDGYRAEKRMSVSEAEDYHAEQITSFANSQADMVSALTLNYVEEAVGICLAAKHFAMPVCISFTTETDGTLPDGTSLARAIDRVEQASDGYPAYYMINCAHPDHFAGALHSNADWSQRIRALRANASRKSHAELDAAENLDRGDPQELAQLYRQLRVHFPQLTILGGCCGTDIEHVSCIAEVCG